MRALLVPLALFLVCTSVRGLDVGGMTADEWKSAAAQRFPSAGVAGSEMNKRMADLQKRWLAQSPEIFQKSSWPYDLAVRVAEEMDAEATVAAKDKAAFEASYSAVSQKYPAAVQPGTELHGEMLARSDLYRQTKPEFFKDANWPMKLAEESISAISGAIPRAPKAQVQEPAQRPPQPRMSSWERAQEQKRLNEEEAKRKSAAQQAASTARYAQRKAVRDEKARADAELAAKFQAARALQQQNETLRRQTQEIQGLRRDVQGLQK